jgi:hypothetical protein
MLLLPWQFFGYGWENSCEKLWVIARNIWHITSNVPHILCKYTLLLKEEAFIIICLSSSFTHVWCIKQGPTKIDISGSALNVIGGISLILVCNFSE